MKILHILRSSEPSSKIHLIAPFRIINDLTVTFIRQGIRGYYFILGRENYEGIDSFGQPLKVVKSDTVTKNAFGQFSELEIDSYEKDGLSNIFPQLYDFVQRIKPDIILASTPLFAEIFALGKLKKRINIPLINYCGSTPVKRKLSNGCEVSGFEFLEENKDIFDVHLSISYCTKAYLTKLGIESKVIYAGINPDEFLSVHRVKKKIIMYSGRFHYDKGADIIPEIVEKILKKDGDVRFIIAGYGPLHKELLQKLKRVEKSVSLGPLDEKVLRKAYCKSHTYFQPSRFEAFCVAVVEAMAGGNYIVCSGLKNTALREIVGNVGTAVSQLDSQLYAEKILESLRNKGLNQAAIERVREKFDIKKQAQEWIKLFNSLRTPYFFPARKREIYLQF